MKNKLMKIFGMLAVVALVTSCGANNDVLNILDSTSLPVLNSFISTGAYPGGGGFTGFTSASPWWTFVAAGSYGSYIAPARGVATSIGNSNIVAGTYVTIVHSGRVATVLHGIGVPSVRIGDIVTAGQTIGVLSTSVSVAFQVLFDGTSVCPLSFVSPSLSGNFTTSPCH